MDLTRCGSARRCGMCDLSSAEVSLSRARKYKNIEFRSLEEPDGALENCGVCLADNGVS